MYVEQFFVDGLGHPSYLVGSDESKEALVVDPPRDVQAYVVASFPLTARAAVGGTTRRGACPAGIRAVATARPTG